MNTHRHRIASILFAVGILSLAARSPAVEQVETADQAKLKLDRDFTILVAFHASGDGALFSRCNTAAWQPDAKMLGLRDGHVFYDIGWLGVVTSNAGGLANGQPHGVVIRSQGGRVQLFVDGRTDAALDNHTRPDQPGHTFHVGLGSAGFVGDLTQGMVENLFYYDQALDSTLCARMAALRQGFVNPVVTYPKPVVPAAMLYTDRNMPPGFHFSAFPNTGAAQRTQFEAKCILAGTQRVGVGGDAGAYEQRWYYCRLKESNSVIRAAICSTIDGGLIFFGNNGLERTHRAGKVVEFLQCDNASNLTPSRANDTRQQSIGIWTTWERLKPFPTNAIPFGRTHFPRGEDGPSAIIPTYAVRLQGGQGARQSSTYGFTVGIQSDGGPRWYYPISESDLGQGSTGMSFMSIWTDTEYPRSVQVLTTGSP